MAVESQIMFRIGSKAIGSFTEMKSALDLLGGMFNKVQEISKELDQFSTMWDKTNKAAVMAADAAAGGLVDTTEVLRGYQRLMKAGVKLTDEQFKTITARAADLAQATGVDATDAFKRLTNSIAKGSTRALKEYGVNVKEGGELTELQTEAVKGLTEGFEGLNVQAKTATERMYAIENNLGTLQGLLYNAVGASDAFGESLDNLNGALGEFNTQLAEAPEAMSSFIFSSDGVLQAVKEMAREYAELFVKFNPILRGYKWIDEKLGTNFIQGAIDKITGTGADEQAMLDELYRRAGEEAGTSPDSFPWQGPEQEAPGKKKRRGGGKGKKRDEFGMTFTEQESESAFQADIEDLTGGEITGDVSDLTNEQLAQKIELEKSYTETIRERDEALQVQKENEMAAREKMMELAEEEEEQRREQREADLKHAAETREAWMSTYDQISAGAQKQHKWIGALSKGMHMAVDAAVSQEKNAGAAIVGVLGEVGSAISQEAGWQALMEVAKAIAAAASQNYGAAAAHGAAAVAFGIAAAAAGGGGKGSGGAAAQMSAAERQSSRFTGEGLAQNQAEEKGGESSTTITIQMREGAAGFFDAMVEENDRASIDGRRNFQGN